MNTIKQIEINRIRAQTYEVATKTRNMILESCSIEMVASNKYLLEALKVY